MLRRMMAALLLGMFVGLVACNTMEGAGRDVESAGETIQREADQNRPSE